MDPCKKMEHIFYCDGNSKKISWVIKSDDITRSQTREHAEIYLDKVNDLQSKYIALHVGIFWSIGVFIIKNTDTVKIILDDESMYKHLISDKPNSDKFIERRTFFIKKLIEQRKLKVDYLLERENPAKELL